MLRTWFTNIKINPTLLCAIYRKCKIKRRRVRIEKRAKLHKPMNQAELIIELHTKVDHFISTGVKMIYIDESLFTRNTLPATEYALPKEYIQLEEELTHM